MNGVSVRGAVAQRVSFYYLLGASLTMSGDKSERMLLLPIEILEFPMKELIVVWNDEEHECRQYEQSDEPQILDTFFFWKTAVLLAEKTNSKKPQLPETFSEPFCCLVCGLVHKPGSGLDAFRLNGSGEVEASVEIKATITATGFTDVKRDWEFDELYWLSLADYNSLRYEIYRLSKNEIENFVKASGTARDRGTVNLKQIVKTHKLQPVRKGYIGIVQEN